MQVEEGGHDDFNEGFAEDSEDTVEYGDDADN
jgi:hypothetical protein